MATLGQSRGLRLTEGLVLVEPGAESGEVEWTAQTSAQEASVELQEAVQA